jgi:hypothetical protein
VENWVGFIEFFVVLLFIGAWGILELVGKRLDRKRDEARMTEARMTGAGLAEASRNEASPPR